MQDNQISPQQINTEVSKVDVAKVSAESNKAGERLLDSIDLLNGFKEVLIKHGEEMYRLRLTRNGKLILHK